MKIAMPSLSLLGWLLLATILLALLSGFLGFRLVTATSRCDTRLAEYKAGESARQTEAVSAAVRVAAGIHAGELARTRGEQTAAASNTHTRETIIQRVVTTGACVMPKGLPSLAPAVQEARDAARD